MTKNQVMTMGIIDGTLIAAELPTYSAAIAAINALLKERDFKRSVALTHLRTMQGQWRSFRPAALALEINDSIAAVGANPEPESPEGQLIAGAYAMVNAVSAATSGISNERS